jgi:protein-S-isoprenylcysteine O-methyltransferase Ste14
LHNIVRHLKTLIAPVALGFLIPLLIVWYEHRTTGASIFASSIILIIAGSVTSLIGFVLFVRTVQLFIRISDGTIMPWDPSKNLIIVSMYAYVRNPMILSLIILLTGEALLFASTGIALAAILTCVINTLYFRCSEEPGLVQRFGEEYLEYKRNVPRWIPRLNPWRPKTAYDGKGSDQR